MLDVEVFRNPHGVLVNPRVQLPVTHAVLQARQRCGIGELALVFVFGDFLVDEAPFGVRTARVLDCRIHVNAKTVANAPNPQILLKSVVVAVFCQDAEVTLTKGDLVVAGRVVGHVSIRDILNMPHNAVKYFGYFHVSLVVSGDHLATGPVLALVVGDLQDVLRQLVNG